MGSQSRTLSYQYDAGSRRTRLTFPDGVYFAYEHDPAGRLTVIRENGVTAVATFSYNNMSLPVSQAVSGTMASDVTPGFHPAATRDRP